MKEKIKQIFCLHKYEYIEKTLEPIYERVYIHHYKCTKCGKDKIKWTVNFDD